MLHWELMIQIHISIFPRCRFCVGDKFFLKNNMILCQLDYEGGHLNGSTERQWEVIFRCRWVTVPAAALTAWTKTCTGISGRYTRELTKLIPNMTICRHQTQRLRTLSSMWSILSLKKHYVESGCSVGRWWMNPYCASWQVCWHLKLI